jgi:anhydro-N-acetylmuramic acid kinase
MQMDSKKNVYRVLGVMSGTSLDGIDVAEIHFTSTPLRVRKSEWTFTIGKAETIPYGATWVEILKEAIHYSAARLKTLNVKYTRYLAEVISEFVTKNSIENLDAVCSHGHTILHQPAKRITLQIGNLPELAEILQQTVLCDFRVQDVALGGQGAPLVPIGDRLLFSEYEYCLNLGGFANCSFEENGERIAYDICPVNIVLNELAQQLGKPFDDGGTIARNAKVDETLLQHLNDLAFYQLPAPKSLGLEWVQQHISSLLKASKISVASKISTFTEHAAQQLAHQFKTGSSVLVTGGGAYNVYLLERLKHYKNVTVVVPDAKLLEFKEALVFGLLGVLRLRNEVNCLKSVTGATHDHSSGIIFQK